MREVLLDEERIKMNKKIKDGHTRNFCFMDIAREKKDVKICDYIEVGSEPDILDEGMREDCYSEVREIDADVEH